MSVSAIIATRPRRLIAGCFWILSFCLCRAGAGEPFSSIPEMKGDDGAGHPVFRALPMDPALRNPWPEAWEREFQKRAAHIIAAQSAVKANAGNTYFENEKRSYGYLMAQVLGSRGMQAAADLQREDAQHDEWHRETAGIDYYACFTLKHQMRKYFYFGGLLEPAYRQRMREGAKNWTAQDPLRRPHYTWSGPKEGWGPDAKNSWVDVRSTENLYLMRETSVYLMAEETGNAATAALYKKHLLDYTRTLLRIGMGEWDSENYHGHSLAPLANLYDFARDPEVKLAAKACLDWMSAIGAVKYWRGGFNGPSKRDYNHPQPFGGSAPCMLWVMFGDSPQPNTHWESDEVHLITSAYRPPAAVVQLARREFQRPLEISAAKPGYSATTGYQSASKAESIETQYFGHSFQMGSLTGGTSSGPDDVNGFKILAWDSTQGAVALQAVPGPDPEFPGSPLYQTGKTSGENRVAQYGNLAVWLVKNGASPWLWVIPETVRISQEGGVTFLECERTWVSIHPLGTSAFVRDGSLTEKIAAGDKARFPHHQVLAAKGSGSADYCGMAIEVGERETHGSFADFKKAALASGIDVAGLGEGIVQFKASDGKWLGFHWQDDPLNLGIWRNGVRRDLAEDARWIYRAAPPAPATLPEPRSPIQARWGVGTLTVEAGGELFSLTVDEAGHASFRNAESAR